MKIRIFLYLLVILTNARTNRNLVSLHGLTITGAAAPSRLFDPGCAALNFLHA